MCGEGSCSRKRTGDKEQSRTERKKERKQSRQRKPDLILKGKKKKIPPIEAEREATSQAELDSHRQLQGNLAAATISMSGWKEDALQLAQLERRSREPQR